MASDTRAATATTVPGAVLRRWPTWLGIALALVVGLDLGDGVDVAQTLPAMALVYLAAAALRRPSAAWPVAAAGALVILATEAVVGEGVATCVLIGLAVPVVAYALWSVTRRADRSLLDQAVAMVAFGAVAAVGLGVGEEVGAYLVAAGLLAHAVWDGYHYGANRAVARSYAECCFVMDAGFAIAVLIVTL
jgi:hypothetical protein